MNETAAVETALTTRPNEVPEVVAKRGVTFPQWNALCNSVYPGANPNSVILVLDYCKARGLDPMKKPCHIVPMEVEVAKRKPDGTVVKTDEWRDVVMPGIYEYRTTAQRTGEYLGHDEPAYGPLEKFAGVEAPAWCKFTVYRWNTKAQAKTAFPVVVYFREVVATTRRDGTANARWRRAPIQMLVKCAEAAALREAFPEELGGVATAEEIEGTRIQGATIVEGRVVPDDDDLLDYLDALAAPERAEYETLMKALKLQPGEIRALMRRFDANPKGLLAELRVRVQAKPASEPPARAAKVDAPGHPPAQSQGGAVAGTTTGAAASPSKTGVLQFGTDSF